MAIFDDDGLLFEDGMHAAWIDVIAKAGALIREQGMRLDISDGPDGETLYRAVYDS